MLRLSEDNKKYYMDLNENARGRFLKVSEIVTTQDSNRGYSRFLVTFKKILPKLYLLGVHTS